MSEYVTPDRNTSGTGLPLNSPGLDPTAKTPKTPPVRAVEDWDQAAALVEKFVNDNSERNMINARIMAAANQERPWPQAALDTEGLGYKSNFSTQVLTSLIDRISPRFSFAVSNVKYLTSSSLPDTIPGAASKSEAFRREITDLCRGHPEWSDFVDSLAQENALFGYTCAGWTDEFDWFPTHFRGDRFFIPVGTRQLSTTAPALVLVEPLLPHELFQLVQDREAAESAGWDVEAVYDAINKAMPESKVSKYSDQARFYEDLARENTLGNSLSDSAKIIKVYNLMVVEVTGKVTHLKLCGGEAGFRGLFRRDDRFDSMADVATFFSFQYGNGTMHGSKGVGRIVYNMAKVIDRARNEVMDRLQLSGKVIISGPAKELRRFRLNVFGNAILIGDEFEVNQKRIDPAVEEFFQLDTYMTSMLDNLAGNVSPRQLQGERVTAKQVELFASREEEAKDAPITRFLNQFSRMITTIQKRACSKDCDDPRAKAMRERLLRQMSEEELNQLAESPSANVVNDLTELDRQRVILVAQENQGNPLVDQTELKRRQLTAQVDEQFAEAVLLPQNDPVQAAEQTRAQQLEGVLISAGTDVAVSPRDNHRIHLDTLWPSIDALLEGMVSDPAAVEPILQVALTHARTHVQLGIAEGVENFAADQQKLNVIQERLMVLKQHEQALQKGLEAGLTDQQALQVAQESVGAMTGPEQSQQNQVAPGA